MADKKVTPPLGAYPQPQPPQGPFLPAPPHQPQPQYSVGGAGGYMGGMMGGGMYPPYDQLQHHQPLSAALTQHLPMYSPAAAATAMYGYNPGYIGYPVQYYPYYPTLQPAIQPLRPTIMIPNGFEGGARLEPLGGGVVPPAPPNPHLAALHPHQLLWR